jgi:hypothetical protein
VKISFLLSCKNGVQSDALIKCVVVQSHKQTQITIDALPLILAIMQQQGFKLSGELIKSVVTWSHKQTMLVKVYFIHWEIR